MSETDIFSKIRDGTETATIVYKNEYVTAFHDIAPNAPVHILIIPNKKMETLADATDADVMYLGHMLLAAKQIAKDCEVDESGYRLIMNINHDAGQEVRYVHMHLVGGLRLGNMITLPSSSKKKMHKLRKQKRVETSVLHNQS